MIKAELGEIRFLQSLTHFEAFSSNRSQKRRSNEVLPPLKFKSGLIQTLNSDHLKELNVVHLSRVYSTTVVLSMRSPTF